VKNVLRWTSKAQLAELRRASSYPKLRNLISSREFGALINRLHGALVLNEDEAAHPLAGCGRDFHPKVM